jgi:lipoyl-dependent peroxiredoxin
LRRVTPHASAARSIASQHEQDASHATVTCAVSIGPRDGGDFALAVIMRIVDPRLAQQTLEALVHEAHERMCPYSHATRGNIAVEFDVQGA